MLFNLSITELIISVGAVLLALTFHEFAHGFVAYKLGDQTAYFNGRLTLNPLKHLDPFGALCLVFFHFGWAKPVPIDLRNFKNPRRDFALSALAGPLTNIIFAFISAFFYLLFYNTYKGLAISGQVSFITNLTYYLALFFSLFHQINLGLGVFNLLPIPPFDGSRILGVILPPKLYYAFLKYERNIYWVVVLWLLGGGYVYRMLLSIPFIASNAVLSAISRVFYLSGLISDATTFLSSLMLKFWMLLPIF